MKSITTLSCIPVGVCRELWWVKILKRKTTAEPNVKKLCIWWSYLLTTFFNCIFSVLFSLVQRNKIKYGSDNFCSLQEHIYSISIHRKVSYLGAPRCYFWAVCACIFLEVQLPNHTADYSQITWFPKAFRLKENSCKYWHLEASFLWNINMQYLSCTLPELFLFWPSEVNKIYPWILKLKSNSANAKQIYVYGLQT